jgi:hypothetical protein
VLVEWLKVKALSSSPVPQKNKKEEETELFIKYGIIYTNSEFQKNRIQKDFNN